MLKQTSHAAPVLFDRLCNGSDLLKEDLKDCGVAVLPLLRLSPGGGSDEKHVRYYCCETAAMVGWPFLFPDASDEVHRVAKH